MKKEGCDLSRRSPANGSDHPARGGRWGAVRPSQVLAVDRLEQRRAFNARVEAMRLPSH
jgi:hypothetical protein